MKRKLFTLMIFSVLLLAGYVNLSLAQQTATTNADIQRLQKNPNIAQSGNYGRTPGGIVDLRTGQMVAPSSTPILKATPQVSPQQFLPPKQTQQAIPQQQFQQTDLQRQRQAQQAEVERQRKALQEELARKQRELAEAQKRQAQEATEKQRQAQQAELERQRQALQQELARKQKELAEAQQRQAREAAERQKQVQQAPTAPSPVPNADIQRLQRNPTIAQSGNYGRSPGGIVDLKTGQIVAPSSAPTLQQPSSQNQNAEIERQRKALQEELARKQRELAEAQKRQAQEATEKQRQAQQAELERQRQALQQELARKQKELAEAQQRQAREAAEKQKLAQRAPTAPSPVPNADIQHLQRDPAIAQSGNYGRTPGGIVDLKTGQIVAPSTAPSAQKSSATQSTSQAQTSQPTPGQLALVPTEIQKPTATLTSIEKQGSGAKPSALNVGIPRTPTPRSGTTPISQPVPSASSASRLNPGIIPGHTAGTTPMTQGVPPLGTTKDKVASSQPVAVGTGTTSPQDAAMMQQQIEKLRNGLASRPPSPMETSSVVSQLLPGGKKLDALQQLWHTGVDLQVEELKTLRRAEQALRAGDIGSYKANMAQARALDKSAVESFSAAAGKNLQLIDQQAKFVVDTSTLAIDLVSLGAPGVGKVSSLLVNEWIRSLDRYGSGGMEAVTKGLKMDIVKEGVGYLAGEAFGHTGNQIVQDMQSPASSPMRRAFGETFEEIGKGPVGKIGKDVIGKTFGFFTRKSLQDIESAF